ncbi:MAG: T9SS type A sorting domain-containing protein [Bacteroidia bacterium]|nr:T9SS type A sorting domain-containing protein [Bacteroidia bacterium]
MIRDKSWKLALIFTFYVFSLSDSLWSQMTYPGDVQLLGSEEIVFDWTTDACEQENIPDAPARAFRDAAGNVNLSISHYHNYRMLGADFNSLVPDCSPTMISDFDSIPQNFNDYEWIVSTYTHDGINVMAVVHNEHHGWEYAGQCNDNSSSSNLNCWYNTMTYALSTDSGKTFTQAAAPDHFLFGAPYKQDTTGSGAHGIFEGSNIIKSPKDGFYYRLVKTESIGLQGEGTSIVRTDDPFDPQSWRGWDGEGFNVEFVNAYEHPERDPADHVLARIGQGFIEKMNLSISWNTYFNKFVLVGAAQKSNVWGIYYALSDDLIHWTARKRIMQGNMIIDPNRSNTEDILGYPSLIDHTDTTRNFEVSGQEAHLYFTRWRQSNGLYDRDLVRIPIRFSKLEVSGWTINGTGQFYDANPGDGICATSAGKCNLNAAFQESNSRLPGDSTFVAQLDFNTTAPNIKAQDQLFGLTYPLVLDATDLAAYSANTTDVGQAMDLTPGVTINLNGNGGIAFGGKNSGIRGIALRNMSGAAVYFSADSGFVEACVLGSYAAGTTDEVSATDGKGVKIENASYVRIGGPDPEDRNMILGGVQIIGSSASHNKVEGNYIGTDIQGDSVFYVNSNGVSVEDGASYTTIGGNDANRGNVISGHTAPGIALNGATYTDIINNLIGTDASGTKDRGNQRAGISLGDNSEHINIIGNVIANNSGDEAGIWAVANIANVSIEGNFIGTDRSGMLDLGNGDTVSYGAGITFGSGAHNVRIGGTNSGQGNVIAYNRGHGIWMYGNTGNAISILGNSIHSNGRLGIELPEVYFHDPIDDLDADGGANDSQNFPEIHSASLQDTTNDLTLIGEFHSEANKTFHLEFFLNATCDDYSANDGGFGEGEELLGTASVTTDANGDASFHLSFDGSNAAGKVVTATATSPDQSTSEFSQCVAVAAPEAEMELSTHAFLETVAMGSTGTDTLIIYSIGTDELDWSMQGTQSWLSTQPSSGSIAGGDSTLVLIQYDAANLTDGSYNDTLSLLSNDPNQQLVELPVEIYAQAQPDIYFAFDTIEVSIPKGGSLSKYYELENRGSDPLSWQLATQAGISWLHQLQPNSGSIDGNSTGQFGLKYQDTSLVAGVYYGAAWISSNDPDESQTLFTIELTVTEDSTAGSGGNDDKFPDVQINVDTLFAVLPQGGSQSLSFDILNQGDTTLDWSLQANANIFWINLLPPTSGSIPAGGQANVQLQLNAANVTPGNYYASLFINTNDPAEPQVGLVVKMKVEDNGGGNGGNPELLFSLGKSGFCPGEQIQINYQIKNASPGPNNQYQLFASAPDGDFSEPFMLANITSLDSLGSFQLMIPEDAPQGSAYKLRLHSTQPALISQEVGGISIYSLPSVSLAGFEDVCQNLAAFPLTQGQPAGGEYLGSGISNGVFDPSQVQPGVYTVMYKYINNEGCAAEKEELLKVVAAPEVDFPLNNEIICDNQDPILLDMASPAGGFYSGNGVENDIINPALAGVGSHPIRYTVVQNGCRDSAEVILTISGAPSVSLAPLENLCYTDNEISLQGSPAGGTYTGPGINNSTFNPILSNPGIQILSYEYSDGSCSNTASIEVNVVENPAIPRIEQVGDSLRISGTYEKVEWYRDGQFLEGENGNAIFPQLGGSYKVIVFGAAQCSSQSEDFLWQATSIDEELQKAWSMYPNPASDQLTIEWDRSLFDFEEEVSLRVFDNMGRLLYQYQLGRTKSKIRIPIDQWPSGIYTVEIRTENRMAQRRLVVDGTK